MPEGIPFNFTEQEIGKMISRIASAVIGIVYLIIAWYAGGPGLAIRVSGYLIFCLGCIWFSEEVGNYTGRSLLGNSAITQSSPGCMVAAGGWMLLLLPLFQQLIVRFAD